MRLARTAESSLMASKDKAPEAEDAEKPDGEAAAPKKSFLSKKMLMIAAPVLVLVLAGGGAGAYFLLKPHGDKDKLVKADETPQTPPQVAFSDVPDILVNIQSNDG